MSTAEILEEMLAAMTGQVEAITSGDYAAMQAGAERHERLLRALQETEIDGNSEQIREIYARLEAEKAKLQSLLAAETARTDFLLRLILGDSPSRAGGYPGSGRRTQGRSRMLNRRA